MQRIRTLPSERFTAAFVIMSLVAGVVLTVALASIPVAQMPVSPDQWWMWCWAGFGAWFGLTFQFLRAPAVRFIPLPLAGLLAFAAAQIVTVTVFDSTTVALPAKAIEPGKSETITFDAPAPGTYMYMCTLARHWSYGMVGKLTVEP